MLLGTWVYTKFSIRNHGVETSENFGSGSLFLVHGDGGHLAQSAQVESHLGAKKAMEKCGIVR